MNPTDQTNRKFLRNNVRDPFVLSTLIFILLGLIAMIFIEKGDVLVWFGQQRSYMVHYVFYEWTKLAEEEVFIALIMGFALFYSVRKGLSIGFIGLAALFVSFLLKKIFQHPRPSEFFADELLVKANPLDGFHIIGGMTSFPSGHTIGAFALFGFIALSLKNKILSSLCFVLALGVGISRIYLINHFLQDVLFGAAIGLLLSISMHWALERNYILNRPAWMWKPLREIWRPK